VNAFGAEFGKYASSVRNTSSGVRGVQTTTHVLDRHLGGEYYVCQLLNSSFAHCCLAWQAAQEGHGKPFYCSVHIFYPASSSYYASGNHEYQYTYGGALAENAWHTLRIEARYAGSTHYWNLYCNGNLASYVWWPYPTYNMAVTQLECIYDSYFFQGRHRNIYLKCADDVWRLQNSSWGPRILSIEAGPYHIIWNYLYYDWEARL